MNSPLKQARLKHEKTLQEVADAVGIDTGNLSRIERPKRKDRISGITIRPVGLPIVGQGELFQ